MFLYPGYGTLDRVDHSNPGFHTLTQPFEPILTPDDSSEAFILYRQHHQAAVTAQHPRLPNPDVSKIIGEQWRNENETVKEYWKKLAEEEKRRHHELYPDYRYTPRRGARSSGARPSSVSSDEGAGVASAAADSSQRPARPRPSFRL
ncbi:unnamed protein product [Parascedosporium putredinis]|uniref:HMG box domain-containing protein n=1 Tax=Parascedosporium putredinis TaxID=1442378 RepID=A0A9P1GWR1_9PEZI|nr:unnamed protein product [Parascedosporium putredinis]CAI7989063.1 unnamed protein product [Parascedosporium putredinis]